MTHEETIGEVTRRLVGFFQPLEVYLIGSAARGEARKGSDLDFVVVVPDGTPRDRLMGRGVQRALWEVPVAVDVMPVRESVFRERPGWVMSLPAIALREGRLVYASSGSAS